jgi:hypothetical protein
MSDKSLVYLGAGIGGTVGGLAPALFGAGAFSAWGVIGSFVGGALGIWIAWRYLHS